MLDPRSRVLDVLKNQGRGTAYDAATKLYLLSQNPERSPIVTHAEIAECQRKLEAES